MPDQHKRFRIETEAIVVGYAMSRLDREYLDARNCSSWEQAFAEAANALSKPPRTFDNLRDEFDPVHPNPRRGWHQSPLRPNRQRVLDELSECLPHEVSARLAEDRSGQKGKDTVYRMSR